MTIDDYVDTELPVPSLWLDAHFLVEDTSIRSNLNAMK